MEITFLPTHTSKTHLHVEQLLRTPSEHWQKSSDFQKGKLISTELSRAKDIRKKRDNGIGTRKCTLGREL